VIAPRRAAAAALALLVAAGCAHRSRRGADGRAPEEGLASFYADRLRGRPTASGAPYDPEALTCAHRHLPLGSRLRVTSLEDGRSVVVTVTDRGPRAEGRVVDLSRAAARALGLGAQGLLRVRLEPLD